MAPWTTTDFPPLGNSTRSTRPYYAPPGPGSPFGWSRRGGGPRGRGGSPGWRGNGRGGRGTAVLEREKLNDEPKPFEFDEIADNFELGGSHRGGGGGGGPRGREGSRGGSRGWWADGRGGRGATAVLEREKLNNEPNPFEVDKMVDKFDDLEVVEDSYEIAKNSGINFDAYEDIPVEASGQNVPSPVNTFAEIDLGEGLNDNIRRCKYVKPTPIQRHAIPIAIAGRDLMACAQTGSGKTAAFCFPIISGILRRGLQPPRHGGVGGGGGGGGRVAFPAALIISPTRELTCQINEEAKKFAYQTGVKVVVAYGGAPMFDQLRKLDKGVDILVATPGRLVDMMERGKVSLCMIRYLALDEADRMLDMGFEPQIRKIVQQMDMPPPGRRQTLLFSATFPAEIQRLASDFLSNYVFLTVGRVGSSTDLIAQRVEFVHDMDKKRHLKDLLISQKMNGTHGKHALTIVFVETKRGADELEHWLSRNGFPATAIHGDKVQMERERALRSFKTGATPVMVATDVAARGLDIPCVAHVINFDLPRDIDDYVHRIGRTGRAGKSGLATAFFSDKNLPIAKALAELMEEAKQEVPSWLTEYADSSSSYGYGGGRRYRGGKFGGHDYRSLDQPATNYSDYSSPFASEVPVAETIGTDSSDVKDSYASPAYGFTHGYDSIDATGWD